MTFRQFRHALMSFAFLTAITVSCGGGDTAPAETQVPTETQDQVDTQNAVETPNTDLEESAAPTSDPIVTLMAESLMSDPEVPVQLSMESATCIVEWAITSMEIEDLDDLEALESMEDEMWTGGFTECIDSGTMIELIIADMGATEEQTQCLIDSLGDETEGLAALFEMEGEPESEEQMTALFSFMAAGMECGLDLME